MALPHLLEEQLELEPIPRSDRTPMQPRNTATAALERVRADVHRLVPVVAGGNDMRLLEGAYALGFEPIPTRSELGAGFLANGIAWESGLPTLCLVITSVGVYGVAQALYAAFVNRRPVVLAGRAPCLRIAPANLSNKREIPVLRTSLAISLVSRSLQMVMPQSGALSDVIESRKITLPDGSTSSTSISEVATPEHEVKPHSKPRASICSTTAERLAVAGVPTRHPPRRRASSMPAWTTSAASDSKGTGPRFALACRSVLATAPRTR